MSPDPARLTAALAAHPPTAPTDWGGPAARAFAGLETRLRTQLARADAAASELLQATRTALAHIDAGVGRG